MSKSKHNTILDTRHILEHYSLATFFLTDVCAPCWHTCPQNDSSCDPSPFWRASTRLSVDPIEMSKPVTGLKLCITNQQAAQLSVVSPSKNWQLMKADKIGGSPDHHKLSDHSDLEAKSRPVSRDPRTGQPERRRIRGEVR